jgi:class 3 adenylate cyclase
MRPGPPNCSAGPRGRPVWRAIAEISALFADLRGFTAFAESAEPAEVLGVLRAYHGMVGEAVASAGGTVEHFAGDGLMAFFNDPTPLDDHQRVAAGTAQQRHHPGLPAFGRGRARPDPDQPAG